MRSSPRQFGSLQRIVQSAGQCALVFILSCSASKERADPAPLVNEAAQVEAACADADWRAARLCEDADCRTQALGASCLACVPSLTENTCQACLGELYCAHPDNIDIAASVLARPADTLENVRVHRVGRFPIGGLTGASREGKELVVQAVGGVLGESRSAEAALPQLQAVTAPGRSTVLTDDDQLLWQIGGPPDECAAPTVSPMGRWVATVCGSNVRVYELGTGFLRHDLVLDEPIDPLGLLGVANLSPLYHCFGGDKHLALPLRGGWSMVDLDSGRTTKIVVPDDASTSAKLGLFRLDGDEVRVALSWDGSHIAVGNIRSNGIEISVFAVDGTSNKTIDLPSRVDDFAFDGSRTLIVDESAGFSRFDLAGVRLEESSDRGVSDQIAAGRAWWVRSVEAHGAAVWQPFGRKPLDLNPNPAGTGRAFEPPQGLVALDTVVALEDGRFVGGAPLFGATFFDADGKLIPDDLGRGEPLWLSLNGADELVVAHDDGVRIFEVDTFESRRVPIPPEYAQVAPQFTRGWIVATGTAELPFRGLKPNEKMWVRSPAGKAFELVADTNVQSSTVIGDKLYVATLLGISIVDLTAGEPKARPAHRFAKPLDLIRGDTAKFGADGKFAVVLEDGQAKLYETSDFTRSIDSFPAESCAFSDQAPTLACLAVSKDLRSMKLLTYDLTHRTEIMTHNADSNAARGLAVLRVMDVTADGRQIALGRADEWITVADLQMKQLLGRRGRRAAFIAGEVASTDGVYLYIEDLTATASSEPLPD